MINGQDYDWESTTITLPTGIVATAQDIEYKSEHPIEPQHGRGSLPYAYGKKEWSGTFKLTISQLEFATISAYALGLGRGILGVPPFPILVSYANADQPVVNDTLPQCKIESVGKGSAKGNTGAMVEIEGKLLEPTLHGGVPDLIEA